ncbi:hypothetical protein GCM10018781_72230 [Kitasatospora indigofera]|uniref:Uncharacterized protein n=1 Tax=Kitasatospora indigofera TaxID=67307 RepID=A0A919GGF5_9ACTN|nr:hypothetical protein GCM10018781_72230 [Kitasatospora indigofera]
MIAPAAVPGHARARPVQQGRPVRRAPAAARTGHPPGRPGRSGRPSRAGSPPTMLAPPQDALVSTATLAPQGLARDANPEDRTGGSARKTPHQ